MFNRENNQYETLSRKLTAKLSLLLITDGHYIIHTRSFDHYEILYVLVKDYNSFKHELLELLLKKMKILYELLNILILFNE